MNIFPNKYHTFVIPNGASIEGIGIHTGANIISEIIDNCISCNFTLENLNDNWKENIKLERYDLSHTGSDLEVRGINLKVKNYKIVSFNNDILILSVLFDLGMFFK